MASKRRKVDIVKDDKIIATVKRVLRPYIVHGYRVVAIQYKGKNLVVNDYYAGGPLYANVADSF